MSSGWLTVLKTSMLGAVEPHLIYCANKPPRYCAYYHRIKAMSLILRTIHKRKQLADQ